MKLHFSCLVSRLVAGTTLTALAAFAWAADDQAHPIGRFEITRFEVSGNTLLEKKTVDDLLAGYVGKERDFGDVQRALEALEGIYRQHGYNIVQVALPEQELNRGVVRLQVIETKIGKVKVEGNKFFDTANIRRSVPQLREGEKPNIGKISTSLRMANENPSKKTTLQLQSADKDDEIHALLKVDDSKTWRIGANLDNTGNESTGKTHAGLLYQNANVTRRDDVLSLQYTTTLEHPSKVSVYGAGYHLPLYALGDSIDVFGSYSNVDSGTVAAGIFNLQISGKGAVYGMRYNHNFKRLGSYDSKLISGLDYKAYKNNVQLQGVPGVQLGNDVTVHPFSLGYNGTWTLPAGEAGVYVTALRNIPGGSLGGEADFNRVRSGASAQYKLLRYGASVSHMLPKNWQLRAGVNGQYTRDRLIPGEQFGAGGNASVRGFNEREMSNDKGYSGNVELYTPNLCDGIERMTVQCRMLAFYDSAYATRNYSLPGEQAQGSIGSVGVGLRMMVDKYLNMQMDLGRVVDAGGEQAKGDARLHVQLGVSY